MLAWIDTETTGLDPQTCDLLEIAIVITDDDLNTLVTFNEVIHVKLARNTLDEWIVKTHGESGLLDEVDNSKQSLAVVETELVKGLLCEFSKEELRKTPIAGSSVHFDRAFLQVHAPALIGLFSHRTLDVSSLSEATERWSPRLQQKRKKALSKGITAHRAMADIEYSIASARWFRKHLFRRGLRGLLG